MSEKILKQKEYGIEAYRILACMLVIINHCNSKVMLQLPPGSLAWCVTVGVFYVTKVAVPGFLMIAGFNLLHKKDDNKKTLGRIIRILVVLIAFSLIYYVWKLYMGAIRLPDSAVEGLIGNIWGFVYGFVSTVWHGPITDAYWYLYMYLGLMIVLPFLQRFAGALEKSAMQSFLLLTFAFCSVWPMLVAFVPALQYSSHMQLPLLQSMGGSIGYMMLGHYIYLYRPFLGNKKINYVLGLGMLVGFSVNMIVSLLELGISDGKSFLTIGEIEYLPLALESICLFLLLNNLRFGERASNICEKLGAATLGVYLLADMLCTLTHPVYYYLCPYMSRLFAVAIEDIVAISAGFLIILILRKIPIIKMWI